MAEGKRGADSYGIDSGKAALVSVPKDFDCPEAGNGGLFRIF